MLKEAENVEMRILFNVRTKKKLGDDFSALYRDKLYTDVSVLVGKNIYELHKCVLACRSPTLRAMLSKKWRKADAANEPVELKEITPSIFEAVIEFMYSGRITLRGDQEFPLMQLLRAAEFFQMQSMHSLLIEQFVTPDFLTIENIPWMLEVALNAEDEKTIEILSTFVEFMSNELYESNYLENFTGDALIHVISNHYLRINEQKILIVALRWLLQTNKTEEDMKVFRYIIYDNIIDNVADIIKKFKIQMMDDKVLSNVMRNLKIQDVDITRQGSTIYCDVAIFTLTGSATRINDTCDAPMRVGPGEGSAIISLPSQRIENMAYNFEVIIPEDSKGFDIKFMSFLKVLYHFSPRFKDGKSFLARNKYESDDITEPEIKCNPGDSMVVCIKILKDGLEVWVDYRFLVRFSQVLLQLKTSALAITGDVIVTAFKMGLSKKEVIKAKRQRKKSQSKSKKQSTLNVTTNGNEAS